MYHNFTLSQLSALILLTTCLFETRERTHTYRSRVQNRFHKTDNPILTGAALQKKVLCLKWLRFKQFSVQTKTFIETKFWKYSLNWGEEQRRSWFLFHSILFHSSLNACAWALNSLCPLSYASDWGKNNKKERRMTKNAFKRQELLCNTEQSSVNRYFNVLMTGCGYGEWN